MMPHSDVNDDDSSVHEDDDDQSECQYILMILIEARMRENQNLRLPRFLGFHNFPNVQPRLNHHHLDCEQLPSNF